MMDMIIDLFVQSAQGYHGWTDNNKPIISLYCQNCQSDNQPDSEEEESEEEEEEMEFVTNDKYLPFGVCYSVLYN